MSKRKSLPQELRNAQQTIKQQKIRIESLITALEEVYNGLRSLNSSSGEGELQEIPEVCEGSPDTARDKDDFGVSGGYTFVNYGLGYSISRGT